MIVERTNVNKHVLILILNAIAQSFTFLLYGKFWDNSEVYMWCDFFFFLLILQMSLKQALLKNKKTKHWQIYIYLTRKCTQVCTMLGVETRLLSRRVRQPGNQACLRFQSAEGFETWGHGCSSLTGCAYGKNSVHGWNYFSGSPRGVS